MLKNKRVRDGHIHTPYCPHGTLDDMELYVKQAIKVGLKEITFTEHMPLPDTLLGFDIPKDSALSIEQVDPYLRDVEELKNKYRRKIKINRGFEVDYVEGQEDETRKLLDKYGKYIEDSLLSTHILKIEDAYYCVDNNPKQFGEMAKKLGGVEKLYDLYFKTLLKSIKADLGPYKPRRIGHPTLVKIFQLRYPFTYKNIDLLEAIVKEIKQKRYEIDFNTAGIRKPFCRVPYPSGHFMELIKRYNVDIVYGSDAHQAEDVGRDFGKIFF